MSGDRQYRTLPRLSRVSVGRTVYLSCAITVAGVLGLAAYRLCRWRESAAGLKRVGTVLARLLEHLGPAFIKVGQVLSTRHDLFPPQVLAPLERLQDRVRPISAGEVRGLIERHFHRPLHEIFGEFDDVPLASASIAQVHVARLKRCGRRVVVKVKRPGIGRLVAHDAGILLRVVGSARALASLRDLPLTAAMQQVCDALVLQTDFEAEARAHQRFYRSLSHGVRIPELLPECCSSDFLVMEYLPGLVKVNAPSLSAAARQHAVLAGLRALYEMIFCAGLIHCDLHPGNLQSNAEGELAVLDFGFWAQLPDDARRMFAEFFLSIALNDGHTAAQIVCSSALWLGAGFNREAFEADLIDLIDRSSRLRADEFLVSEFVFALFSVQRRHGVAGSPDFTMAIVSLLIFEGIARPLYPGLDFQREAVPFLLHALEERGEVISAMP